MAVFERLANSTLREQISAKIKHAILAGRLHEGERLVERTLAAQFETSLTAVREALVQLEIEGFVSKKANSATHVSKFSLEAAEKISKVRRVLETFAVEEAARLATPEQIRELEESYLELLDTARAQNVQEYQFKDLALHEKIWELASNEYLQIALRRIVHPIFAIAAIRLVSVRPFDLIQDTYSHLPIIEAIKRKNPDSARQAFLEALSHWSAEQQALASPTAAEFVG
jgi:DNA-binding GntR family transcriptional regulator